MQYPIPNPHHQSIYDFILTPGESLMLLSAFSVFFAVAWFGYHVFAEGLES